MDNLTELFGIYDNLTNTVDKEYFNTRNIQFGIECDMESADINHSCKLDNVKINLISSDTIQINIKDFLFDPVNYYKYSIRDQVKNAIDRFRDSGLVIPDHEKVIIYFVIHSPVIKKNPWESDTSSYIQLIEDLLNIGVFTAKYNRGKLSQEGAWWNNLQDKPR